MIDLLVAHYAWIKALHIVSVISWMAGMLYLPRLFVYHAGVRPDSPESAMFKVMEYRLMKFIMFPASVATVLFGLLLIPASGLDFPAAHWFHVKLAFVAVMVVLHHLMMIWRKQFARDQNRHAPKFFRIVNEVPTLLMIAIVILVVVKPF